MTNENFKDEITKLEEKLPINYQFISSFVIDKQDILRVDDFPYYNSSKSVCKDFHRPISKLYDKEGRI
jgi:hypothetical protein